jgi:hypothetical protein
MLFGIIQACVNVARLCGRHGKLPGTIVDPNGGFLKGTGPEGGGSMTSHRSLLRFSTTFRDSSQSGSRLSHSTGPESP